MSAADLFMLAMRWLHALAAVAWVGGSVFFIAVLRPALRRTSQESTLNRIAGQEFRQLVDTAIWVLLVTGAVLSVDRLTAAYTTGTYGVVLGLKVTLAIWMSYLVWFRGRRSTSQPSETSEGRPSGLIRALRATFSATNLILILGLIVVLLADILRQLVEQELGGG